MILKNTYLKIMNRKYRNLVRLSHKKLELIVLAEGFTLFRRAECNICRKFENEQMIMDIKISK